jgi:hypothetical protein
LRNTLLTGIILVSVVHKVFGIKFRPLDEVIQGDRRFKHVAT